MNKVDVIHLESKSNYPVNSIKIKQSITKYLEEKGKDGMSAVVIITGRSEMLRLGKRYLKEKGNSAHNVLSFTESELRGEFVYPPGKYKRLGEIVICYPVAKKEAGEMGVSAEDRVVELAIHGAEHLLGKHHD